jgi:hypothetical protein
LTRSQFAVALATVLSLSSTGCQKATGSGSPPPQVEVPIDRITLPDTTREFVSPSGRFAFVVSTKDGWKSLRGTGELFAVNGPNRTLLWSRALPQQFGPRFALLNDRGTSLMLDEWINVSTGFAVLILDRDNQQVAQHSTDAVQAVLQVPIAQVVEVAKHGWWIQAPPVLAPSGDVALVQSAGKQLAIRLDTGSLSLTSP